MANQEILEHWAFNNLPFVNRPVDRDIDKLFANRTEKLREITYAEGHGLICFHGIQGIGKTSLFHKHGSAAKRRRKSETDFLYSEIVPQKDRVLLQILRAILLAIKNGQLKVRNKAALKIDQKLSQLELIKTTTESLQGKVGPGEIVRALINLGVTAKKQTSISFNPITDESAAEELKPLLNNIKTKTVIIIDNLEKLANFMEPAQYAEQVSQLSQLLDGTFDPDIITIGLAVDQRFVDQINRDDIDEFATHSFQRLIEIDAFEIADTRELIAKRLKAARYIDGFDSFIEQTAVESLQNLTEGHPRGIITVLGYAIEIAYERKMKRLDRAIIAGAFEKTLKAGLFQNRRKSREIVNDIATEILDYIRKQGGQWASNTDFQKAIGLNKSQLSDHLNRLESQGMLKSKKEKRGGTTVKMFRVP